MFFAGLPLPRHGFRHLSCPQPCFTFPPRTDFQIVSESVASSYSAGPFQISIQQELAEIRLIEVSPRQREFLPPTFAASRKGHRPSWAKPIPLSPLITLAAARFQLLTSAVEGGLHLSIEDVVAKARDYASRETKGVRAWTPAVYHSLRYFFQLTHCVGDSYIVADPGFVHWIDTIPRDLGQLAEYRVLVNLCGHTDLPFVPHDPEDISRWIAQLPKYAVVVMNSLSKWACFAKG